MGDAIVPITSRLPGRRTGEAVPRDGKPFDPRRTGPAARDCRSGEDERGSHRPARIFSNASAAASRTLLSSSIEAT